MAIKYKVGDQVNITHYLSGNPGSRVLIPITNTNQNWKIHEVYTEFNIFRSLHQWNYSIISDQGGRLHIEGREVTLKKPKNRLPKWL